MDPWGSLEFSESLLDFGQEGVDFLGDARTIARGPGVDFLFAARFHAQTRAPSQDLDKSRGDEIRICVALGDGSVLEALAHFEPARASGRLVVAAKAELVGVALRRTEGLAVETWDSEALDEAAVEEEFDPDVADPERGARPNLASLELDSGLPHQRQKSRGSVKGLVGRVVKGDALTKAPARFSPHEAHAAHRREVWSHSAQHPASVGPSLQRYAGMSEEVHPPSLPTSRVQIRLGCLPGGPMIDPVASPYLVPFDGSLKIANTQTAPDKKGKKKALKAELGEMVKRLSDLQEVLYAHNRYSLLMVFQAMDAAGKDSTIRAVLSGVNPAGCQVFSFKQPSKEEYDHDFLWRTSLRLPERGRIGVFNRSHYESVLVVKVHPEYLGSEQLPEPIAKRKNLFQERYASIRDHEQHLARNGTVILKFFLNVGRDEQKARFLKRLNDPSKNWKFAAGDLAERALWPKYMDAYQDALNETSRPCAPWYAIPADDKPSMRLQVATIAVEALSKLDMGFPTLGKKDTAALGAYKARLEAGE